MRSSKGRNALLRCYLQMRDTQVSFISDSDDVSVNVCALVCLSVISELVVNNIWDEFPTPTTLECWKQ